MRELVTETIRAKVAEDNAFINARKNSDKENARIKHDKALARAMISIMNDDTVLYKQFADYESFKLWLSDRSFGIAYEQAGSQ